MDRLKRGAKTRRQTRSARSLHVSEGFASFVVDQLSGIGDVVAKPMFGGVGLYAGGVFFGIIARDTLFLKVDATNRPDYERAGMKAFKPNPGRSGTMKYYAVPVAVLESAIELAVWARKAVRAATSAQRR